MDSFPLPPKKKRRRPNFDDKEIMTLIEEVKKRERVVMGKLDTSVTGYAKDLAWHEIAQVVNTVSRVQRDRDEVRGKFKDLKCVVRKKSAKEIKDRQSTDGGQPQKQKYTEVEEAMLYFLSPASFAARTSDRKGSQINLTTDASPSTSAATKESITLVAADVKDASISQPARVYTVRVIAPPIPATIHQPTIQPSPSLPVTIQSSPSPPATILPLPSPPCTILPSPSPPATIMLSPPPPGTILSSSPQATILPSSPTIQSSQPPPPTTQPSLPSPATTHPTDGDTKPTSISSSSTPSHSPPDHPSSRPEASAGLEDNTQLASSVLQIQRETRDLLAELVTQQREAVAVQREAVVQLQGLSTTLRRAAQSHQQFVAAIITLTVLVAPHLSNNPV